MPTLYADGVTGTVAIYTGSNDVVANPNTDLSRVLFHSDLLYPTVIASHSGTVSLSSVAANRAVNQTNTLFAHGQSGIPFVLGYVSNLTSSNVALAGSIPIQTVGQGFGRWVTLGADATNVYLHENTVTPGSSGLSGVSLNWVVYITDLLL